MADKPQEYYGGLRARIAAKYTAVFRVFSLVVGLALSIMLVRLLDEEQYGIYNLLFSLVPFVLLMLSFGIDNTLARYVPEFAKQGEFHLSHRLSRVAQIVRLLSSAFVMLGLFLAWDLWAPILGLENYRSAFSIFAFILVFELQHRVLTTLLSAHLLHKYSFGAQAALAICKLIGYVALMSSGLTLDEVLIVDLVAFLIGVIGLMIAYQRRVNHIDGRRTHFGKSDRRRILRYAAFYNFNDIGTLTLGRRFDNFFLAAMIGPIAVGAYSLATMILNIAQQFSPVSFFQTVIQPLFFSLDRDSEPEKVSRFFQLLIKFVFVVNIPVTAFACAFYEEIVAVVFAGKFQEYAWLIPVVFAFGLFSRISIPVSLVAQLAERAGIVLASKIFAVYNVVALIWLVPKIGILGAAIATGTAFAFKEFFIWWHVRKLASFSGTKGFFAISFLFWGAMALAGYGIQFLGASALVTLVRGSILFDFGVLVYLRMPLFDDWERQFLDNQIPEKSKQLVSRFMPLQ